MCIRDSQLDLKVCEQHQDSDAEHRNNHGGEGLAFIHREVVWLINRWNVELSP